LANLGLNKTLSNLKFRNWQRTGARPMCSPQYSLQDISER